MTAASVLAQHWTCTWLSISSEPTLSSTFKLLLFSAKNKSCKMAQRYGWDDWTDRIGNGEMLDHINRELACSELYLPDSDIREALRDLKNTAEYGRFREDFLINSLKSKLKNDRDSVGGQGFYRSRSFFLVCCIVAQRSEAPELARSLLRFFNKENEVIVRDKLSLLTEWCIGLKQLKGLVDEGKLSKAFRQVASRGPPLFEEWRRPGSHHSLISDIFRYIQDEILSDQDRERDQLILAPRPLPVRRLSGSLCRRQNWLEDPPYPRTTYHSPLLAPLVAARHDLHPLHLHQHLQDWELARLERDFSHLHRHR